VRGSIPPRPMPCSNCGRTFTPSVDHRTICRICQFERQGDVDLALYEEAWRKGHALGLALGQSKAAESIPQWPLRDLIALCHPDRHSPERRVLANTITAWLNELRQTVQAGGTP
jgi:hypothetical protein